MINRITLEMIEFAHESYYSLLKPKIGERYKNYVINDIVDDQYTGADACLLSNSDRIVLNIRGTEFKNDFMDVISNFLLDRDSIHYGTDKTKVHKGYANQYKKIINGFKRSLSIMMSENKRPIYVTGHSLGGAVATLIALDLKINYDGVYLFSFGAPPVGGKTFKKVFNKWFTDRNAFRINLNLDFIPDLIPFMKHANDCLEVNVITGEVERLPAKTWGRGLILYLTNMFLLDDYYRELASTSHYTNSYIDAIRRSIDVETK